MVYTVTEPHPTVKANGYTHSGRGGFGNTFRAPTAVTPAAGVPTTLTQVSSAGSTHSSGRFYAGRGGAGNAHPASERRSVSLDDEYAYAAAVAKATTSGHVGRGGAGNVYSDKAASTTTRRTSTADKIARSLKLGHRKGSDASTSSASSESSDDGRIQSGFWGRLHHH